MSKNIIPDAEPDWFYKLLDRNDLYFRAYDYLSAVVVVLNDAAVDAKNLSELIYKEEKMTPKSRAEIKRLVQTLKDAARVADLCE